MYLRISKIYILSIGLALLFSPIPAVLAYVPLGEVTILLNHNIYMFLVILKKLVTLGQMVLSVFGTLYFILLVYNTRGKCIHQYKVSIIIFFCYICLFISSFVNGVEIHSLIVDSYRRLFLFLYVEHFFLKESKNELFKGLLDGINILLLFNLILLVIYPSGIFIGNEQTRYSLLGLDNQLAPLFLMAILLASVYYELTKDKYRLLSTYSLVLVSAIAIFSVTALIAVIIFIFYRVIFYNKCFNLKFGVRTCCIVYLAAIFMMAGLNIINSFLYIADALFGKAETFNSRIMIWQLAFIQIMNKPLLGYGYTHKIYAHYYAHNALLEAFSVGGIILVIAYSLLIVIIERNISGQESIKKRNFLVMAFVSLLLINFSEAYLFNMYQLLYIMFLSYIGKNDLDDIEKGKKYEKNRNTNFISI